MNDGAGFGLLQQQVHSVHLSQMRVQLGDVFHRSSFRFPSLMVKKRHLSPSLLAPPLLLNRVLVLPNRHVVTFSDLITSLRGRNDSFSL